MRPVVCAATALVLCSTPALAAKFTMQLTPTAQQTLRMQSGIAAVDDSSATSSVRLVQAEADLKKRGVVQILVMNQGDKPFNFGPESISARLADGTPVAIITYEQLVKEEKRRQTWRAVAAGLAAAGNSMSAANSGYYSGTAHYSGQSFGTFGSTPYSATTFGTATYSGYNAGQAQLAQSVATAQNQVTFARMAEHNAANMEALKSYMRTTTVDPQQMFGGAITFELPKSVHQGKGDVPMMFSIKTGGEEHLYNAILKRR